MYTIRDSLLSLNLKETNNQEQSVPLPGEPYYQQFTGTISTSIEQNYGIDLTQFHVRLTYPRWVTPLNRKMESLYKLTEDDVEGNSFSFSLYTSSPSLADKDYATSTVTVELLHDESIIMKNKFDVKADYGTVRQIQNSD